MNKKNFTPKLAFSVSSKTEVHITGKTNPKTEAEEEILVDG